MNNTACKTIRDSISRRDFLKLAGMASATMMMPGSLVETARADDAAPAAAMATKKYPIGLEMYSVRTEAARDLPGTLKAVAKSGFEVVEFYAPYYKWSLPYAKEVRAQLDDLGMKCFSTHNSTESFAPGDGIGKAIELNQILWAKIIVLASANAHGLEGWKQLCGQLSGVSEQLKPHGLAAGFHNHQTEWAPLDGSLRVMDVVAANTPKEFVLQLDVGTCVEAGADPVAWVKANPGPHSHHAPEGLGAARARARTRVTGCCSARAWRRGRSFLRRRKRRAAWSFT